MARDQIIDAVRLERIYVTGKRRPVDEEAVARLATSMQEIGLQYPITVRLPNEADADEGDVSDLFILVAGRHRLEAAQRLGWQKIDCNIVRWDQTEARLWEIAENLHRAELSVQEKSNQVDEWVRLTAQKVSQRGTPGGIQPTEQGIRKAAQELGLSKSSVHRAVKIADIAPEAKEAAKEAGLSNSQKALLEIARARGVEEQIRAVERIAERKTKTVEIPAPKEWEEVEAEQKRKLMQAWNAASPNVQAWFREFIDEPVMGRRFGEELVHAAHEARAIARNGGRG